MISSAHTSAEISYFLHKWFLDAKKILCGNFNIGQIEVDFSWALIHSTCNVFLNCNIESYLDTCWNCSGLNSSVKDLNVIVHLCSAHLMHGIGFHINKKLKINKDVRRLFLHVIGFMVRCTELSKINDIFNSLCRVFMSKYIDESVLSNIDKLESYISEDSQISPDISNDLETDITDTNSIIDKDVKTYKEKSPFGRHFVKIARNCQDDIKNNISNTAEKFDSNICYHPDIIEYLLTFYLPILPLWSEIILGPKSISVGNNYSHYSNATVENWMRILKLDILRSKTNLRPGDLIKILYPSIESRISAFNFAFHLIATKVFKNLKRPRDVSEEHCSEEWSRKNKRHCGYLNSKQFKFSLKNKTKRENKYKNNIDKKKISKFIPKKREKLSKLRKDIEVTYTKIASVITDDEIVEIGMVRNILPSFRPPHTEWQIFMCKKWNLQFHNSVAYSYNCMEEKESLFDYEPYLTENIAGDGNCYFSTISFILRL